MFIQRGAQHHTGRDRSLKSLSYFVDADVEAIVGLRAGLGKIDVLVTHDWPSGVGLTQRGDPAGNETTWAQLRLPSSEGVSKQPEAAGRGRRDSNVTLRSPSPCPATAARGPLLRHPPALPA